MSEGVFVEGLTVLARGRTLVDRVSFDMRAGEIVAVIGPNGAGKTTLFEGAVGLRRRAGGVVRVGGRALGSFVEHAAAFAFAADDASPPAEAQVKTLAAHALAHRPRRPAVAGALRTSLGLEPLLDRPAGVLSRGERKRVALYLALVADRPAVALDEPFGAFDPLQLRPIVDAVRSIAAEGAAVAVTVHQLALAERIAERVLLLSEGRAVAFGSVADIRARAGGAGSLEDAFVALLSRGGAAHAA